MTDSIIILGMHRSGTSCLAGSLKSYGLNMGNVSNYNKYNPKGNQENKSVFKLNEKILKWNGGAWNNPPAQAIHMNDALENNIRMVLEEYSQIEKPWGIKDPRMILTYHLWQPLLPLHHVIATFRHPMAVANSLFSRDAFPVPISQGLSLWQTYNLKLIELQKQFHFPVIDFDIEPKKYMSQLKHHAHQFGLNEVDEPFYDANLVNQNSYSEADCPDSLKDTYLQLKEISQSHG